MEEQLQRKSRDDLTQVRETACANSQDSAVHVGHQAWRPMQSCCVSPTGEDSLGIKVVGVQLASHCEPTTCRSHGSLLGNVGEAGSSLPTRAPSFLKLS